MTAPLCPKCHKPAIGTVEHLTGVATIRDWPLLGQPVYAGDTEVDYDSARTVTSRSGRILATCGDHDFYVRVRP
jgi:hypothetical protein